MQGSAFPAQSSLSPKQLAFLLAPLVALTPFAIDTYLPAMPVMAEHFGSTLAAMGVTISVFLIGYALGQLIGGPLSDIYGRQRMALCGLLVFIGCALGITQTNDLQALISFRFIQALGGGFATVVVAAIVRDHFQGKDSARVFSMIGMIMMIAPLTAPAVGSLVLAWFPWQAIFILLGCYAAVLIILVGVALPKQAAHTEPKPPLINHFISAYSSVFAQRASFRHLFAQASISGILFTFVTNAAFIFMGYFGVSEQWFPLYFAAMVGASIGVNRINLRLLQDFSRLQILRCGVSLQLLCTLSFVLASYFGLANIWVIMPLMIIIVGCIGLIFSNNMSMYLDHHGKSTGSANALFGCSTFTAGALLGSVTAYFFDGSLLPIALTVFISNLAGWLLVLSIQQPPEQA